MGVGMPAHLHLENFAWLAYNVFKATPYHVGSSILGSKNWRDVDIRIMLDDEVFIERYGHWNHGHILFDGKKWSAEMMAWSALAHQMTGLPVDFQVQCVSEANKMYDPSSGHGREALITFRSQDPPKMSAKKRKAIF